MTDGPTLPMIAIGGSATILIAWLTITYNKFARLTNLVKESWADVDVQLKRRYDLIPSLVETVKGYASYEQKLLQQIVESRDRAMQTLDSVRDQTENQAQLVQGLNLLMAKVEAYPELQANQGFLALQHELADTEDRIAAARRSYNSNVTELNTAILSFPSSIVAGMCGARSQPLFEITELQMRLPVDVGI